MKTFNSYTIYDTGSRYEVRRSRYTAMGGDDTVLIALPWLWPCKLLARFLRWREYRRNYVRHAGPVVF